MYIADTGSIRGKLEPVWNTDPNVHERRKYTQRSGEMIRNEIYRTDEWNRSQVRIPDSNSIQNSLNVLLQSVRLIWTLDIIFQGEAPATRALPPPVISWLLFSVEAGTTQSAAWPKQHHWRICFLTFEERVVVSKKDGSYSHAAAVMSQAQRYRAYHVPPASSPSSVLTEFKIPTVQPRSVQGRSETAGRKFNLVWSCLNFKNSHLVYEFLTNHS